MGSTLFGLWLNLDRLHTRSAGAHAQGIIVGSGDGRLPRSWFDGLCFLEEQVEERMYRTNADRADARAMKVRMPMGGAFGG